MLTVISGNNRNGYPCALNKVGDIFQRGIPPFETEGLTYFKSENSQDASQKGDFPLAGLRGQMLGSVKVTASEESKTYAEVTVSMTSGNSTGCSLTGGLRADNLLNKKAESAFVQAAGKEKGPAVSPALLSTSMISCTGESNELQHNSYLQATGNLSYSRSVAPQWAARFGSLRTKADIGRFKVRFFYVRNQRCAPIMVGRSGEASAPAGFFGSSLPTPLRLATPFGSGLVRLQNLTKEAATMATTQTRPEFIDTYWIIPEYSSEPYGKVSFTRQDRRTFIAMFKDSRLIWAGRQPVKYFTENVERTESPKLPVKETESRSQFNQSPGLLVRKMPHEGIEEISIPQGGVNITPPSTITNIVTVQEVAHV